MVDPGALGLPIHAVIRLRTTHTQLPRALDFASRTPEITSILRVTGEDCLVIEAHCSHARRLEDVVDALARYGPVTTSLVLGAYPPSRRLRIPRGDDRPIRQRGTDYRLPPGRRGVLHIRSRWDHDRCYSLSGERAEALGVACSGAREPRASTRKPHRAACPSTWCLRCIYGCCRRLSRRYGRTATPFTSSPHAGRGAGRVWSCGRSGRHPHQAQSGPRRDRGRLCPHEAGENLCRSSSPPAGSPPRFSRPVPSPPRSRCRRRRPTTGPTVRTSRSAVSSTTPRGATTTPTVR
ncbi:Lrp/AsnC family transcriptional regulator [Streptomyces sp. NPDC005930]|uniref:Lrp/AsnC family transcriptional regulator n=1 Tax=Streptomyces sp. NPDC005930 TaxID=3364736 RepID=UPI0036B1100A